MRTGAFHPSQVKYSAVLLLLVSGRGGSSAPKQKVKPQTAAAEAITDPLALISVLQHRYYGHITQSVHFEEKCTTFRLPPELLLHATCLILIRSDPNVE